MRFTAGLALLLLTACPTKAPCSALNCSTCCDAMDRCVIATTSQLCGTAGARCIGCAAGLGCSGGTCISFGNPGGGSGGGLGGGGGGLGGGLGGGAGGGAGGGTMMAGDQVVLQTVTWRSEGGVRTEPGDFSVSPPELFIRSGTSFTAISGHVADAGRYEFANVPAGERYLRWRTFWIAGPANPTDFSTTRAGRTGIAYTDGGATALEVNATGQLDWTDGSELQISAPNVGALAFNAEYGLATPLAAGPITSPLTFDWGLTMGLPAQLVDTTRGDVVHLSELIAAPVVTDGGTLFLRALARSARLDPLTLADHAVTTVNATFTAPTTMGTATFDWRRSSFWQFAADARPDVRDSFDSIYLSAVPYTGTENVYTSAPDLVSLYDFSGADRSDLMLQATYGNPFPSSWPQAIQVSQCFYGAVDTINGRTTSPRGCLFRTELAAGLAGQPITPVLSPPRMLQIDGQSGYTARTLSSLTPTLSWSAPTLGTAAAYSVSVRQPTLIGTFLSQQPVGSITTAGTSVVIPPGMLQTGQPYYFRVAALMGGDPIRQPFRGTFPESSAQTASSLMRTP